jgi:hypothetical protein
VTAAVCQEATFKGKESSIIRPFADHHKRVLNCSDPVDALGMIEERLCRRYSKAELVTAARFHLIFSAVFEPPGEICGTKYDETKACQECGSTFPTRGRSQGR